MDEEAVSEAHLRTAYSQLQQQVGQSLSCLWHILSVGIRVCLISSSLSLPPSLQIGESLARQEDLVRRIEAAHAQFERETQAGGVSEREVKLKQLAAAFDAFQELLNNLTEGTKVMTLAILCCVS